MVCGEANTDVPQGVVDAEVVVDLIEAAGEEDDREGEDPAADEK
jgi:hypothetical protein